MPSWSWKPGRTIIHRGVRFLTHPMMGFWLPQWVYYSLLGSQFFLKSCPALSTWCCAALRLSVFTCFPCLRIHLSPSLACDVQLFGRLSLLVSPYLSSDVSVHLSPFVCLPVGQEVFGSRYFSELISLHLSSNVPILVSGSSDVSLHLSPFICLHSV